MKRTVFVVIYILCSLSVFAQKTVDIAILNDQQIGNVEYEELVHEIRSILGSDYNVTFQEPRFNYNNLDTAKAHLYACYAKMPSLIIASGITNATLFYQEKNVQIPTIVIGGINKDLVNIPLSQKTSQKHNVNYIVLPDSYTEDLNDFSNIYNYKNVGIILDKNSWNTLPIQPVLDSYFQGKSSSYTYIPMVNNTIDTAKLNNVDAVYLASGFGMENEKLKLITDALDHKKLPSFTINGLSDVEKGFLVTNKPESAIHQLFRKIALHTEAIVNGENPANLPLFIEYKNQITINHTVATKIDLKLRYSLLGTANFIGSEKTQEQKLQEVSLKTLFSQVLQENLSLNTDQKDILLADQDVKTSKSNYLPDLGVNVQGVYIDPRVSQFSTGQNPEFETQGNAELKQLIYSPDATAGIKINKQISLAQRENYNAAQLDALYNMAAAYFNALVMQSNVSIQNQNLQVTKQNLNIANENYKAGSNGKTDVLRFRSQLAQNTQNVIDASNQLQQVKLSINQLRNVDLNTEVELEDALLNEGLFKDYNYQSLMELLDSPELLDKLVAFFIEESKQNSPELKSLSFNIAANDLNYRLNKNGRYIPTVALQGQYNLSLLKTGAGSQVPVGYPNLPNNTYNAAINISLPIFNQNTRNIKQQTTRIQAEQLQLQKENLELNLNKQVRETVLELMSNIANIELSAIAQKTAKESLELAQSSYQAGSIPVIQLIDAQTNYMQAQLANTTARYQFLLSSFQLERYLGHFFIMQSKEENQAFYERAKQFIILK